MKEWNDLTYEWPPDIIRYEAQVVPGLTWLEAISAALACLLPMAVMPGIAGLLLSVLTAAVTLLSVKRFDRLGGTTLVGYLLARLLAWRRNDVLELPLIMAGGQGAIHVETWEGERLLTLE